MRSDDPDVRRLPCADMAHLTDCDALAVSIEKFAAIVETVDLTTPIPSCPAWDLAGLTRHVGRVHRWSADVIRTMAQDRPSRKVDIPDDPAVLPDWIRDGGAELLDVLRSADGDAVVWAWGADQHVRFWSRRQLHETEIHLADASLAAGLPFSMTHDVAGDGIDELLDNLPHALGPGPKFDALRGHGESLHLHATDGDGEAHGEWMIKLNAHGVSYEHGHGKGDVAVRGTMTDLALMMWGRLPAGDDRFTHFGDTALLERWLANTAF